MQNVLIIGGLGFIGYHTILALQREGYNAVIGSRSGKSDATAKAPIIAVDLKNMSDEELLACLTPFDAIIFAGGADDRTIPNEPAKSFFYQENVLPCVRLAQLSERLRVNKIIILGSYFTYFNRTRPEWAMAEHHPYVRSRVLQQSETLAAAPSKTKVITLELPYIFGASPDKIPLWQPLVQYINSMPWIFYTKGGTNIVAVEEVANAIIGAVRYDKSEALVVGGDNVTWVQLIGMIATSLGKKRSVITLPNGLVKGCIRLVSLYFRLTQKQAGLNIEEYMNTQTAHTHFDPSDSMRKLNYGYADMQKSIDDTVKACT